MNTCFPFPDLGKRACPPEDCGGVGGYYEFLAAISDPKHEEHQEKKEWAEEIGYEVGNPADFDPASVFFPVPGSQGFPFSFGTDSD